MSEIIWLTATRGTSGRTNQCCCMINVRNSRKNPCTTITLYAPLMKDAHLVCGDRVLVGYDDSFIYIKRVLTGGYMLGARGLSGEERTKALGMPIHSCIKLRNEIVTEQRYFTKDEISISHDGIITIPKG